MRRKQLSADGSRSFSRPSSWFLCSRWQQSWWTSLPRLVLKELNAVPRTLAFAATRGSSAAAFGQCWWSSWWQLHRELPLPRNSSHTFPRLSKNCGDDPECQSHPAVQLKRHPRAGASSQSWVSDDDLVRCATGDLLLEPSVTLHLFGSARRS